MRVGRRLAPGGAVPAPTTGIYVGENRAGPVRLRLFRQQGTRMVVFSAPRLAQLLTLRAAVSGVRVRILTQQQAAWMPALRHGSDAQFSPINSAALAVPAGPNLLVEDLPDSPRHGADITDWQCLIHVRDLDDAALAAGRLSTFAHVDVVALGALSAPAAAEVGRMFNLGKGAASLTVVPPHAVALVTRGRIELVRPEPTAAERTALQGDGPTAGAHAAR